MNTKDNAFDPEEVSLVFNGFFGNSSYQMVDNFTWIGIMLVENLLRMLYGHTQKHFEFLLHTHEMMLLNTSVFVSKDRKFETRGYVIYHRGGQVDIYAKLINKTEEETPSEMIQLCHFDDYTTFWQWVRNPMKVENDYMDTWRRFCDKHIEEWEKERKERQEEERRAKEEEERRARQAEWRAIKEEERRKKEAALLAFSQFLDDERKKGTEYVRHISDEDWEATLASLPKTNAEDLGSGVFLYGYGKGPLCLVNKERHLVRWIINENRKVIGFGADDFDLERIGLLVKEYKPLVDMSAEHGILVTPFRDGFCVLHWFLSIDGRYYADEDGYGMDDQEEVRCFIDRNLKVIIPILRMDYIDILYPMEQKAKKIVQESEIES